MGGGEIKNKINKKIYKINKYNFLIKNIGRKINTLYSVKVQVEKMETVNKT